MTPEQRKHATRVGFSWFVGFLFAIGIFWAGADMGIRMGTESQLELCKEYRQEHCTCEVP